MIAPELVPVAPAHNLLDLPQWQWLAAARGAERPLDELPVDAIFSTFPPGTEPDAWPLLPPREGAVWSDPLAWLVAGLMLLVFVLLFIVVRRSLHAPFSE